MARLTGTFSRLGPKKVLVIGDFLLDTYTVGKARRISPEAPVAVIHVQKEEHRPGGAGNVVLNLISMGCQVIALGRLGNDVSGSMLLEALKNEKVDCRGLYNQIGYQTPVKNRIIAENQQIVRVDYEQLIPLPETLEQEIIDSLPKFLEDVKIVAISDYGKGFLSRTLLRALIEKAKQQKIPVITDPKGIDFVKYAGSTIIKPNLSEAYMAAGLSEDAGLDKIAQKVLQLSQSNTLMVTRSEAGLSLFHDDGTRQDFPVKIREVKDVTGAGDTVLAMMACAMANDITMSEAAQLSNMAAGMAIERFGCARITLSELARRLLKEDITNKVFDEEHLFALQQALKRTPFNVLGLSSHFGFTLEVFNAIRHISKSHEGDLIVYVKDTPSEDFINLLASLNEIDFILINKLSLQNLCSRVVPSHIYELSDRLLKKHEGSKFLLQSTPYV